MLQKKRFLNSAAALFGVCLLVEADGDLSTSELLESSAPGNPELVRTLRQGFDLDSNAWGVRIGQAINPRLGGTRIGPYTLHGRLRSVPNAVPLTITLNTDIVFLDGQNHKVDKLAEADSLKEILIKFEVSTTKVWK